MITQLIEFDVKKDSHVKITAKEGDINSRYLEFRLLDNSLPFSLVGRTVRCYMVKPDKRIIFNDLKILDAEDGRCVLKLSLQSLIVSGMAKLELIIYEAGKKLSIIPIKMDIIKSLNSNELLESTNEFGALNDALWKIDTFKASIDSKASKEDLKKLSSQLDNIEREKADEIDLVELQSRVDLLSSLESGSTTGDAELVDGRVGARGEKYSNIGNAIRSQISNLLSDGICVNNIIDFSTYSNGYITSNGGLATDTAYHKIITLSKGETVRFYARGYLTNVSMISKKVGTIYTPLVISSNNDNKWFEYTAKETMEIVLSFLDNKNTYGYTLYKTKNVVENMVDKAILDIKKLTSSYTDDCYINASGNKILNTVSNHIMSDSIALNKGDVIFVNCSATKDVVSVISKVVNGVYTPLVKASTSSENYYRYEATENMKVVISASNKWNKSYTVYNKFNASLLDDKISKALLDIKNESITYTDDCYINVSGTKILGSASNHVMSDKITLNKGDVIIVVCSAAKDIVSVISKVSNNIYTPLVKASSNSEIMYRYEALENIDIVISASSSWNKQYTSYNKFNSNQLPNIEDSILPSFSMFEKFGVIGDSYASGEVCLTGYNDYYNVSWGQILARMTGTKCINFSSGGLSTRSWLLATKGLQLLNSSEVQQLYILALGINDWYALGSSYLGTKADIESKADTFYGNYAKIIEAVKAKAPKSKIVLFTIVGTTEIVNNFNTAIKDLATYYGIPCIDQNSDPLYTNEYYTGKMLQGHPVGTVYSAMAKANQRLIEKCMKENHTYFKDFIG